MPQFKQFPLPDTGEGLTEAEILTWHVKPGDTVTVNQIIVEIETAKAAVELPCPFAGVVTQLHAQPGETVEVGVPIITVDVDPGGAPAAEPPASDGKIGEEMPGGRIATLVGYGPRTGSAKRRARKGSVPEPVVAQAPVAVPVAAPVVPEPVAAGGYVPLAKPPVRKLAKELGVDLRALNGSGRDGVITREDVESAARNGSDVSTVEVPGYDPATRERRVAVRGVRKATAQAMVDSAFTAPHVTEFLTIDVTPMMELRARLKNHPEFRDVKITPLAFAARAVCLAIKRTPDVNASWDAAANEIVYKSYAHLGIAAATPRGLVVPKVRDADAMSLRELGIALEQLTATARDGKTTPADMQNGTFTITNIGVFGIDTGTPIINPGESAILALGAIRDMPWVVDGQVVPRKVCQLALSFDHRVVDGQQGSQFLADVGALLADPAMAFTF
ncbi:MULTISPECIES: dihydrolipoamide acetyltransferase family protein [unclassified Crossiella]|uniref:dihydrolipoamide acetyltransferase family protein n=1 Tax=unclassified Crossiella TaxID=2620835 RepID=UPI001FFFDC12|nr:MULTISPECIES: dihydrolipoamide acetyltransferase family protein [unclassified Crossiella]MCK2236366.1 2-oxo acid dehydrogenase subunit E2 [Crossiella sp. S99.2]MCK2250033.1 2-oxo acid dehydrogenase subunit E2 [Crossiella sp. S99.1]